MLETTGVMTKEVMTFHPKIPHPEAGRRQDLGSQPPGRERILYASVCSGTFLGISTDGSAPKLLNHVLLLLIWGAHPHLLHLTPQGFCIPRGACRAGPARSMVQCSAGSPESQANPSQLDLHGAGAPSLCHMKAQGAGEADAHAIDKCH